MVIQFFYKYDGLEHKYSISQLSISHSFVTPWPVEIKRKNANNNRQTSWWKKVVLFFVKYLLDLYNQNVK